MTRGAASLLVLFVSVGLFLIFVGGRIGDRTKVAEQGQTVLVPLAALGPRDLSLGDRIELIYEMPEIVAELRAGNWPEEGAVTITPDRTGVARSARRHLGGQLAESEILLNYRFTTAGTGLWPSDRPRLYIGDSFFLVTEGRITDYLDARYAVLKVSPLGAGVVIGLADGEGLPIDPGP